MNTPEGTAAEQAEARRAMQRRLACIPTAVLRSMANYHELRKMNEAELQAWMDAHPADAIKIAAAAEKRKRREEARDWNDWRARVCSGKEPAAPATTTEAQA
jgi:hypothetical protein